MNEKQNKLERLTLFFIGDSAVGKTSFLRKYTNNIFDSQQLSTFGIDFSLKTIKINGEEITLKFFDTAGQEQYRSLSSNLIKSADGIFLMYDITNRKTFEEIGKWIESIKESKKSDFPIVLIGNKCDLENERMVKKKEGEKFAQNQEFPFPFRETSCKDNINIEESVQILVNRIIDYKDGNQKTGFTISQKDKKEKKKSRC
jgi:small GTP-binding protein